MSDFIELLTTTNYDICNRLIFGVLARYLKADEIIRLT